MPVLVMNVILPPQYYDINLSTDKKQILLFKEDVLFVAFQEVFRSAVDASNTHMQVTSVETPIPSFFERQKESGKGSRKGETLCGKEKKKVEPTIPPKSVVAAYSISPSIPVTPIKQIPVSSQPIKRPSPCSLEDSLHSPSEKRVTPSPRSEKKDLKTPDSSILTLVSSDGSFNTNISMSSICSQWDQIQSHISSPTKLGPLIHPRFAESQSDCSDPSQSVVETELTLELSKARNELESDV